MKQDIVAMSFNETFVGTMSSPTSKIAIGDQNNGLKPYHLLFGALGSCFYATFLSIAQKMRLVHESVKLEISGKKRDELPNTLEYVKIEMVIKNGSDEEKLKKAAELGAKYCSIHETISKVATIELVVIFES